MRESKLLTQLYLHYFRKYSHSNHTVTISWIICDILITVSINLPMRFMDQFFTLMKDIIRG